MTTHTVVVRYAASIIPALDKALAAIAGRHPSGAGCFLIDKPERDLEWRCESEREAAELREHFREFLTVSMTAAQAAEEE